MKVRFIQSMAGVNPDGTSLFITAGDEADYPDFEVHRLIGSGICAALDPKDQESALKRWAKLKDDEAKAAEAAAEKARKEAEAEKKKTDARAIKAAEAGALESKAHDKRMEARRARDAVKEAKD